MESKPLFKIGEWVSLTYKVGLFRVDKVRDNTGTKPPSETLYEYTENLDKEFVYDLGGSEWWISESNIIKWLPKENDLIVNYSLCDESLFSVHRVKYLANINQIITDKGWVMNIKDIEPYRGTIPYKIEGGK